MGGNASSLDDHETELLSEYKELMKDKVHRYVVYGIGSAGPGVGGLSKETTFDTHEYKGKEDVVCTEDLRDLETYCKDIEDSKNVHILQGVHNSVPDNPLKVGDIIKDIKKMVLETALIDAHLILYYTGNSEELSGNWKFPDGTISYRDVVEVIESNRRNRFLMVYIISDCCYAGSWVEQNHKQMEAGGRFDPCIRVISSCTGSKLAKHRLFAQSFWGKVSVYERAVLPQVPAYGFEKPFKLTELHRPWFDDNRRLELAPVVKQESGLHWHDVCHFSEELKVSNTLCTQCEFDNCFLSCPQCAWRLCMDCYNKGECAIKIFPEGDKYEGHWDAGKFHGEGIFLWVLGKEQYEGRWHRGLRQGHGKMQYKNGDFYEGEWKAGERWGEGVFVSFNGDRYMCEWVGNKRHGKGTVKYANGDKFEGNWVEDQREGEAVFTHRSGSVFRGTYVDDKKNGHGVCVYKNGDRFEGLYENGVRCGHGSLECANGDGYIGDWAKDVMHGRGVYTRRHEGVVGMAGIDAENAMGTYEGEFKSGHKHGQGVFEYDNGDIYDGGWADGYQSGQGTFTFSNGEKYIGQFKHGKFHGMGHYWYQDTSEYEGEYVKGKPGGRGYRRYANGDEYEGDWVANMHDGQGTKLWAADNTRYDGQWRAHKRHGKGRYAFPNGETYAGDWVDDRAEGKGVYSFLNGNTYIGEFKNNEMDGHGRMVYPNNDSYEGVWRRDKRRPECPDKKFYRTDDDYVAKWNKGRRIVG